MEKKTCNGHARSHPDDLMSRGAVWLIETVTDVSKKIWVQLIVRVYFCYKLHCFLKACYSAIGHLKLADEAANAVHRAARKHETDAEQRLFARSRMPLE